MPELLALAPKSDKCMGNSSHANSGALQRDLNFPDIQEYALDIPSPGEVKAQSTDLLGQFLCDVFQLNADEANFRIFGPDETDSNHLGKVFGATARTWMGKILPYDENLSRDGRVIEVLREHLCQGWLESYLLTECHSSHCLA